MLQQAGFCVVLLFSGWITVGFAHLIATHSKSRQRFSWTKGGCRKKGEVGNHLLFISSFSLFNSRVFHIAPLNVWADARWLEMIRYFLLDQTVQMDILPFDPYPCTHWAPCCRTLLLAGIMQTALIGFERSQPASLTNPCPVIKLTWLILLKAD